MKLKFQFVDVVTAEGVSPSWGSIFKHMWKMLNLCVSSADQETAEEFLRVPTKFYTGSMSCERTGAFFFSILNFNFYFILLYNTVLVLPYIDMNPPWVYMSSQSWTPPPTFSVLMRQAYFTRMLASLLVLMQVAFWLMKMLLNREAHRNLSVPFPRSNSCIFSQYLQQHYRPQLSWITRIDLIFKVYRLISLYTSPCHVLKVMSHLHYNPR